MSLNEQEIRSLASAADQIRNAMDGTYYGCRPDHAAAIREHLGFALGHLNLILEPHQRAATSRTDGSARASPIRPGVAMTAPDLRACQHGVWDDVCWRCTWRHSGALATVSWFLQVWRWRSYRRIRRAG